MAIHRGVLALTLIGAALAIPEPAAQAGRSTRNGTEGLSPAGPGASAPGASRPGASRPGALDGSVIGAEEYVLHRIQRVYLRGITRCYKKLLRTHKDASGPLKLSFLVNEQQRVERGDAQSFAEEVDTCIEGVMKTWRFQIPKDLFHPPHSMGITLQLVPG